MSLAIVPDSEAGRGLRRELGIRDLALFGIVGFTGPRWIPAAAHAGPGSVAIWLLAGLVVGAPLAVVVPALMAKYPGPGGLYGWTRNDFGPAHGFIAFWLYWVGMAFWFPSAAIFYVTSSAYTFGPAYAHLADSRTFLLCCALACMWIALGSNLIGLKTGKWTENAGAIAVGVLGAILVAAAALHGGRQGSATELNFVPKMPRPGSPPRWGFCCWSMRSVALEAWGPPFRECRLPRGPTTCCPRLSGACIRAGGLRMWP